MAGRIAVVDAQNRFLRWEARHTIHVQRLPHRSIHILVFNRRGEVLLQKRHRAKQTWPGHWDLSCAGHVEESDYLDGPDAQLDQVYLDVAQRELHEELGVRAPLTLLGAFAPVSGVHYEHMRLYRATHDGPFTPQADEVEDLMLADPSAVLAGDPAPQTRALGHHLAWMRDAGLL